MLFLHHVFLSEQIKMMMMMFLRERPTIERKLRRVRVRVTIRYDSVYITCSKKLTGSQLSPPDHHTKTYSPPTRVGVKVSRVKVPF